MAIASDTRQIGGKSGSCDGNDVEERGRRWYTRKCFIPKSQEKAGVRWPGTAANRGRWKRGDEEMKKIKRRGRGAVPRLRSSSDD
jgi:hypothetical protein